MTLTPQQETVRQCLIQCAREERIVTFGEVGEWIHWLPHTLGQNLLTPINNLECAEGRPLLSAIVVNAETGLPGEGFFRYARICRKSEGLSDKNLWHREVGRVFEAHKVR